MKKKILIALLIILSITGGWLLMKENQKKDLLNMESPRIEKYLKYNYKDIKSVTFTDVSNNPTGVPHIKGYVNNDKKQYFDVGIYSEKFDAGLNFLGDKKPDYKNEGVTKTVTEIEKEEAEQQKKSDN